MSSKKRMGRGREILQPRVDETYLMPSNEYPNDRIERSCLTRLKFANLYRR